MAPLSFDDKLQSLPEQQWTGRGVPPRLIRKTRCIFGTVASGLSSEDGRFADEFTEEELNRAGIELFDIVVYEMFLDPFIKQQLKLTSDQLADQERLEKNLQNTVLATSADFTERMDALLPARPAIQIQSRDCWRPIN